MNILLVQALTVHDQPPIYPLGLCNLASYLPDHNLKLIDMNIEEDINRALDDNISKFKPDVIGLSLRNIKVALPGAHKSCYLENIDLISRIKSNAPENCRIIIGGAAFSLYAEYIMKNITDIDYGVFSEAELTFPKLLKNLESPEKVLGVYYRDKEMIRFTGFEKVFDFANSLLPRRDLIDISPYLVEPVSIGVMTKRGCVYNCVYCSDPYLLGKKIRVRSPSDVADEVEDLVNTYGVKNFQFSDQVFNIPIDHAIGICMEFIERKISVNWGTWLSVKPLNMELLTLMEQAGCCMINYSPDSTYDKVLARQGKAITEKDIANSYNLSAKTRIKVDYSFMFNGPGDNLISFFKLVIFVIRSKLKLKKQMNIHANFVIPMRIYPHSELQKIAISEGMIKEDDDLIEPSFYNPYPLSILINFIVKTNGFLWGLMQRFKRILRR